MGKNKQSKITVRSVIKVLLSEGERMIGDGARMELTREHKMAVRLSVCVCGASVRAHTDIAAKGQPPHPHRPTAAVYHVQA